MIRYLLRRLVALPLSVLAAAVLAFLLMRLVPGDPIELMLASEGSLDTTVLGVLRERFGLDQSWATQLGAYLLALTRGELGTSIVTGASVANEIIVRLPHTLALAVAGAALAMILGLALGILAVLWRGQLLGAFVNLVAIVGVASPAFWFAILLLYFFAFRWGWFPMFGAGAGAGPVGWVEHLILPALAVAAPTGAAIARMTRATLLEEISREHVRYARSKGLGALQVLVRHTLRTGLLPVVTLLGIELTYLLSGTVVVETVFSRPGLGLLVVEAVRARDYTMVQGTILTFSVLVLVTSLVLDVVYAQLDPRVRLA